MAEEETSWEAKSEGSGDPGVGSPSPSRDKAGTTPSDLQNQRAARCKAQPVSTLTLKWERLPRSSPHTGGG